MNGLKLILFACLVALFQLSGFGQNNRNKKNDKIRLLENDTAYQRWQEEIRQQELKNKAEFLEFIKTADPDTIKELSLTRMGFTTWPDITRFDSLTRLVATGNNLTSTTLDLSHYPRLKSIVFSGNKTKRIRFSRHDTITVLSLSENELKRIPRSIRKLTNLKILNLSNNHIKRIPRWLKRMSALEDLDLNYNRLKLTRASIRRLQNMRILQLGGNQLTELPDNIGSLHRVKKLNLGKNQLSGVPASMVQLDSLNTLIFYSNKFRYIPLEITQLPHLAELDYYYNELETVPLELGNMTQLKRLYLAFNQLETLPDTLRNLQQLRYFYVHHNLLGYIPDWIAQFQHMEILDISYNNLFEIPDFSTMPALYELDIQHNEIAWFPWALLEKPNLKLLLAKDNPFILDQEQKTQLEMLKKELGKIGVTILY